MSNKKLRSVSAAGSLFLALVALGSVPEMYARAVSIASVTGRVADAQGCLGPVGNISASNFGQITTASDPRIMQASMKLVF